MAPQHSAPLVACNGAHIPSFGLGTWELREETARAMVREALTLGVRHIDTARIYGNERVVGEGIRSAGVIREEIFLTTKLPPDLLRADSVARAAEEALSALDIGYIDLLLIHWPSRDIPLKETLKAFAALKRTGMVRHIGVSNFSVALVEEAVAVSPEPIVTNQVEYHPYLQQGKVLEACRRHGISLTAYSPLARGRVANDRVIGAVARDHQKTAAQVALRWLVQQEGVIVIPRSSKKARLVENFSIYDFSLSPTEMSRIAALAHPAGRQVDPIGWAPVWD
jgi:diketogulonate reductase-like aldo/keto reductase